MVHHHSFLAIIRRAFRLRPNFLFAPKACDRQCVIVCLLSPTLSVLMALVTIDVVVDIPGNFVVMKVVRVVSTVAARALENGVIIRMGVTGGAHVVGIAVTGWEWRVLRVTKARIQPVVGAMAFLAGRREKLRLREVPWIRCVVVIRLVAADAVYRQSRVIAVDVAVGADPWWHCVGTSQRERCLVVVEG